MRSLFTTLLSLLFPHTSRRGRVSDVSLSDLSAHINPTTITSSTLGIEALLPYRDAVVRDVIWSLKYDDNEHATELLCGIAHQWLIEFLSEHIRQTDAPLTLVPIPPSDEGRRRRGYNQAARLTDGLTRVGSGLRLDAADVLVRTRPTLRQTTLTRAQRTENVRGAFSTGGVSLAGKHCLLIDDVVTTGATLGDAARALTDAGAASVSALALAYSAR